MRGSRAKSAAGAAVATAAGAAMTFVVAIAIIAAIAVVITTATVIVTVVTATAAAMVHGVKFLLGGGAHSEHLAAETYVTAGQRMIEVHRDFVAADIEHTAHNAIAFGGHHGYGSADFDCLAVKFAVYYEDFAVEVYDFFFVVRAEGLVAGYRNVKSLAGLQAVKSFLKWFKHTFGNAEDDAFGVVCISLMDGHLSAVGSYLIEVVSQLDIHTGSDFYIVVLHCVYLLILDDLWISESQKLLDFFDKRLA